MIKQGNVDVIRIIVACIKCNWLISEKWLQKSTCLIKAHITHKIFPPLGFFYVTKPMHFDINKSCKFEPYYGVIHGLQSTCISEAVLHILVRDPYLHRIEHSQLCSRILGQILVKIWSFGYIYCCVPGGGVSSKTRRHGADKTQSL